MRNMVVVGALALLCGCATAQGVVIDPGRGTGVISDFDDTIAATDVDHPLNLLWNALAARPADVAAVRGASTAFARAREAGAAPFVYVSASPTFLLDRVRAFLKAHDLPDGPVLLKDWLRESPFTPRTKETRIDDVLARQPNRRFILVGDAGEQDPEIYASLRARHADRIAGIVIIATKGADLRAERFEGMRLVDEYDDDTLSSFVE